MTVEFLLLGDIEVRVDERPVPVGHAQLQCTLAVLLMEPDRLVSVDQIVDRVWGARRLPKRPRAAVQHNMTMLRRVLAAAGDVAIVRQPAGYRLTADPETIDAHRFRALLAEARNVDSDGRSAELFERALLLWRGEPFAGLDTPWLNALRTTLDGERRAARLDLTDILLRQGRHAELLTDLADRAGRYPLDERLAGQVMLAMFRAGRQGDALAHYAQIRRRLAEELGADPGVPLQRLHQQILQHDPALSLAAQQHTPRPTGPAPPRQLPAAPRVFTGRTAELSRLLALASDTVPAEHGAGVAVISAVNGMAGVGKSALALHAGHLLADRFPDGQLFLDLHGHTEGLPPREPADALAVLLQGLGVPPERIPAQLDARAAVYRDRLAGTRTLIVLDNAAAEAQVRPLLPGSGTCLVLITSRKRLKALDDAHTLALEQLPLADAVALLRQAAGPERGDAEDPLWEQIARLCGCLPLALRIAAALIRHRPAWSTRHLADTLRQDRPGLEGFADGERDLAAVFDLSYRTLGDEQRQLFRRLGLSPGPDFDAYAAAALLGTDPAAATHLLQDLVDHNLLTEPVQGRYQLHDLIRLHARALAQQDPADQHDTALKRLENYYQHTALRAEALITRHTRAEPARTGTRASPNVPYSPVLPDPKAAAAWLRAERANLLACLHHATTGSDDARVVALSAGLAAILRSDGPWRQAVSIHTAAVAAADRLGDRRAQAGALTERGAVGENPVAAQDLQQAVGLFQELGDLRGQANALIDLGNVRSLNGDRPGAIRDQEAALRLFRDLDDRRGQAVALNALGGKRRMTGDRPGAIRDQEAALRLFQELGDRHGQAKTLVQLGSLRHAAGDYAHSAQDLAAALSLSRDLGDRFGQASALASLGTLRRVTGDFPGAIRALREALELDRGLGSHHGQANDLTELGAVRLAIGDHRGALRDLQEAVNRFRDFGFRGGEAWALNHYAAVFLATGEPEHALALYRDALQLSREVHQLEDEARAQEGIGRCLLHQGDPGAGRKCLARASEIFRQLGMRPDADRVEACLAEDGICDRSGSALS